MVFFGTSRNTIPNKPPPPVFQSALGTEISSERVGTEMEEMLKGCNPHASLSLIHELDLYNEIFTPPTQDLPVLPVQDMEIAADILHRPLFRSPYLHLFIFNIWRTTN
ncbi:hypothetical protein HOY80DRAFT_1114330 [Tuber brumale]|nr:hypothetical protein HOY80DRAFT_1114330 [Tuber brumale]